MLRGIWPMRFHAKWTCWVIPCGPVGLFLLTESFRRNNVQLVLSDELRELDKVFRASVGLRTAHEDFVATEQLPGIATKPWRHQELAFALGKDLPGFQLQMDMGTGKTLTSLAFLNYWRDCHDTAKARVLIVCPKSVVEVWPAEFDKHMTTSARGKYLVTPLSQRTVAAKAVAADKAEDLAFQRGMVAVHVINYDALWRPEMAKWVKGKSILGIICDESHRIKSHDGRASRFVASLTDQTKRRLGLTGTPMPHSPLDIYAQYKSLSADTFGTVWGDFKKRYAVMGGFENKQVIGYQNEADMNWRVNAISFRVKKGEVLDLPPVSHETRAVELSGQARAIYDGVKRDLYAMVAEGMEVTAANALVKVVRLLQITSGCIETDEGQRIVVDESKIKGFLDLMADIPAHEPVVIFTRFTRDIDIIRQGLAEMKRSCAVLDGRMNQLAQWQAGEFDDIAIQIRAGGAGVDLTRSCYAVYYTQTHSLGDYLQSEARLDRPGQTRPVTYYHLVAKGTIDEQIYSALRSKRDVVEYILEVVKGEI